MINFQLMSLNYLAVFLVWVVHVVMGLIWFSPKLFGGEWSKLTGKELKPATQWLIPGLIGVAFLASWYIDRKLSKGRDPNQS